MNTLLQIHEPGQTPLPHDGEETQAVGIDLGTTNSVIALVRDEKPEVLRDENGHALVPSVVAYGADGAVVGEAARRTLLDAPQMVVSSVKRLMGRGIEDLKELAGTLPFEVFQDESAENTDGGEAVAGMVRLKVAGKKLSPVEVSADILRALKSRAQDALGAAVGRAVVTVPAYFDDAARTATRDAARLAGLEVLRLVNEPTAAALAYGLDRQVEGLYAVFDLGGGTFDISILRMEKGVFQVLATGGDAALGGDDFDHALAEHFLGQRREETGEESFTPVEAKSALMTARLAKECLSEKGEGKWMIEAGGKISHHHLDLSTLEELIAPYVERAMAICGDVMTDAGVLPEDIHGVVLVGGSTRVPLVRRRVGEVFGREPLSDIDPDEVVAMGAALQAQALTVGSDNLLLDVTPLSLGIETMGGISEKIVHRNTPIPVSLAQEFTTYQDGQTAMMIHVIQGEREMVDQNRSLARFELNGIPPMTAGAARIQVTFTIDADGLLTVSAREETTGAQQHVEVKPTYGIDEVEMGKMLRDSIEHAQEDMTQRLLTEERVEAGRALAAIQAALEIDGDLCAGDERQALEDAMTDLKRQMEGDDRDAIHASAQKLEEASRPFAERRMDKSIRGALEGKTIEDVAQTPGDGRG